MRADFYNPLIRNPLLAALLPKQQVNIPPMSRDDLARGDRDAGQDGGTVLRAARSSSIASSTTSDWRKAGCRCSSSR